MSLIYNIMREYCKELLGNHVVIECKDKSFLTDIKTIVFEEGLYYYNSLLNAASGQ